MMTKQTGKPEVTAVLLGARSLLGPREHWTRDTPARNADGDIVSPRSPRAACWCTLGAMEAVNPSLTLQASDILTGILEDAYGCASMDVASYNDRNTHSDVLRLLDAGVMRSSRLAGDLQFMFSGLVR